VNHPPVKPALGYRFDFKDRSIAFSGDTTPLEAVAKLAEGADLLVHEVMYVPAVEDYVRGQGSGLARSNCDVRFSSQSGH